MKNENMSGLNIGCGETKYAGVLDLDLRRTNSTEIIADARMLPFKKESFNHVFSNHTIEHFSHKEISSILSEWVRVLKIGGTIEISCPDLRARAFFFFLNPTWHNVKNIYGEQDYQGNYHKCGFSFGLLKSLLESYGIKNIKRIISGYKGIPFIPDCLRIKGTKLGLLS